MQGNVANSSNSWKKSDEENSYTSTQLHDCVRYLQMIESVLGW